MEFMSPNSVSIRLFMHIYYCSEYFTTFLNSVFLEGDLEYTWNDLF